MLLKREVAIAPAQPPRVDELLLDGWQLQLVEGLAERTLVVRILGDLQLCAVRAEKVAPEAGGVGGLDCYVRGDADRPRTGQHPSQRAETHHDHSGQGRIEAPHAEGGGRRQGSSSSGSSSLNEPLRCASSTIRRLSAISGVSYVLRTS